MPIQKCVEVGDHYPQIRDQKVHVVLIMEAPTKSIKTAQINLNSDTTLATAQENIQSMKNL